MIRKTEIVPNFQISSFYDIYSAEFSQIDTSHKERWLGFVFSDDYSNNMKAIQLGVSDNYDDIQKTKDEHKVMYKDLTIALENDELLEGESRKPESAIPGLGRYSVGYNFFNEFGGTVMSEMSYMKFIVLTRMCEKLIESLVKKRARIEKALVSKDTTGEHYTRDTSFINDDEKREIVIRTQANKDMIEALMESFYRKIFNLFILKMSGYEKHYFEIRPSDESGYSWVYNFQQFDTKVLGKSSAENSYPYKPLEIKYDKKTYNSINLHYQDEVRRLYSMITKTKHGRIDFTKENIDYSFGGYVREPFHYGNFSESLSWWQRFRKKKPTALAARMAAIYENSFVKIKDKNVINQFVSDMLTVVNKLQSDGKQSETLIPTEKTLIFIRGMVCRLLYSLYNYQRGNLKRFAKAKKKGLIFKYISGLDDFAQFFENSATYRTVYPDIFDIKDTGSDGISFFNMIRNFVPLSQKFKTKTFGDEYFLPYSNLKLQKDYVFDIKEIKSSAIFELLKIGDQERIWQRLYDPSRRGRFGKETTYVKSIIWRDPQDTRSWGNWMRYTGGGVIAGTKSLLWGAILPLQVTNLLFKGALRATGFVFKSLWEFANELKAYPDDTFDDIVEEEEVENGFKYSADMDKNNPGLSAINTVKITTIEEEGGTTDGEKVNSSIYAKPEFSQRIGGKMVHFFHPDTPRNKISSKMRFLSSDEKVALIGGSASEILTKKKDIVKRKEFIETTMKIELPKDVEVKVTKITEDVKELSKTYTSYIYTWEEKLKRIAIDFYPKIKWEHVKFLSMSMKDIKKQITTREGENVETTEVNTKDERQREAKIAMNKLFKLIRSPIKAGSLSSIPILSVLYMTALVFSGDVSVATAIDASEDSYGEYIEILKKKDNGIADAAKYGYLAQTSGETIREMLRKLVKEMFTMKKDGGGVLKIKEDKFFEIAHIMRYYLFEEVLDLVNRQKQVRKAANGFLIMIQGLTPTNQNVQSRDGLYSSFKNWIEQIKDKNSFSDSNTATKPAIYKKYDITLKKDLKIGQEGLAQDVTLTTKSYQNLTKSVRSLIRTLNDSPTGNIKESFVANNFDLSSNRLNKEIVNKTKTLINNIGWTDPENYQTVCQLIENLSRITDVGNKQIFSQSDINGYLEGYQSKKLHENLQKAKGVEDKKKARTAFFKAQNKVKEDILKKLKTFGKKIDVQYHQNINKSDLEFPKKPIKFIEEKVTEYSKEISNANVLLLVSRKINVDEYDDKLKKKKKKSGLVGQDKENFPFSSSQTDQTGETGGEKE